MEAVGLALSAAQVVFATLQCSQLKDFISLWGYKSKLESLECTVRTIQAVLSDVDAMQAQGFELNATQVDFIEKLKDAVYDADDLLDEIATLAAQQQQQLQDSKKFLKVLGCFNLRSVSRGLEHLAALESLELISLCELRFDEIQEKGEEEEEDDDTGNGMPWRCLAQCLRSLELLGLPEVVELPKGMRYLTALQSLTIVDLPLKDLPEWIACLPSLHFLEIKKCEHLQSLPEALGNLPSLVTDVS